MRAKVAWALALVIGLLNTTGWADKSRPAPPFPTLRLAGPAPAATVEAPAATPAPAAAAKAPAPAAASDVAASAAAAELDSLAQSHYKTGVEMFSNGLYRAAREEFDTAYKLLPLPDFLHNSSLAAEKQGQLADALAYEEHFLKVAVHLTFSEREVSRSRIARLRAAAGIPAETPLPSSTAAAPEQPPKVVLPPSAPPPPPAEVVVEKAPVRRRTPAGALALIGLGSGMVVGGIGCGIGAILTEQSLENGQPLYLREIDSLTARGNALSLAGITLDVVGGVALVAGTGWALWARSQGQKDVKPQHASAQGAASFSLTR